MASLLMLFNGATLRNRTTFSQAQSRQAPERDRAPGDQAGMPFVIYIFALSAFALGLAEFVPIGLTSVMANSLHVAVGRIGAAITAYALGATFSAPILSALTVGWTRKNVMLVTAVVFSTGSLVAALSGNLTLLLVARFVAGMGHGLFLAVASSTAARLAGTHRAGTAVAVVFGGFTLAMAIGVPISTYLGSIVSWRPIFMAIAAFGVLGFLGLLFGMNAAAKEPRHESASAALHGLRAIAHPKLLGGALVTVLAYAGSFTAYTYIAPILVQVTAISMHTVSIFMLIYGVLAAAGNIIGGRMADRLGVNRASLIIVAGIAVVVLGMWLLAHSAVSMAALVALLGLLSYAAVPALQARLIGIAEMHTPRAHGVAAGLNIAGFNSGIALGSVLGGATITNIGIAYTGLVGAGIAGLGVFILLIQMARSDDPKYKAIEDAGH
jgi:MFS transporter, DHA1 family, inner membrane transport protein